MDSFCYGKSVYCRFLMAHPKNVGALRKNLISPYLVKPTLQEIQLTINGFEVDAVQCFIFRNQHCFLSRHRYSRILIIFLDIQPSLLTNRDNNFYLGDKAKYHL